MRGRIAFLALLLAPAWLLAQQRYSLLLAEYGLDAEGEQTQSLVRYRFSAGAVGSRENLLTTRTSKVRYDLGENRIYKNRYVVTRWGDVVDIESGSLLFESDGELAGIDEQSDTVMIRVERIDSEGLFAFDLNSRTYGKVRQEGRWGLPGVVAPGGLISASGSNAEIWLHRLDGSSTRLGDGFTRGGGVLCSSVASPTFLWLDDERVLTQRGNGRLFIVHLNGSLEALLTIDGVDAPVCGPSLERDEAGQVYYRGNGRAWLIDAVGRHATPYEWQVLGNEFDIQYARDPSYGEIVRFGGDEIGRWSSGEAVTAAGRVALEYGPVGSNFGYPEGAKVWSADDRVWVTIKPEWLSALVGWVKD